MCSATDSYDIALSAQHVDICEYMFDGDGIDPHAQDKLDYSQTFAFKDFVLVKILINTNILALMLHRTES